MFYVFHNFSLFVICFHICCMLWATHFNLVVHICCMLWATHFNLVLLNLDCVQLMCSVRPSKPPQRLLWLLFVASQNYNYNFIIPNYNYEYLYYHYQKTISDIGTKILIFTSNLHSAAHNAPISMIFSGVCTKFRALSF